MTIRIANEEDIERIVQLRFINAQYHAKLVSNGKLKTTTESFFEKDTKQALSSNQSIVLVGVIDNAIESYVIGCIGQQHPIFDFKDQALIQDLFVGFDFQRMGYGNMLIDHILEWFKEHNIKRIDLNVYEENFKGRAFWNSHEFKVFFKRMTKTL